MDMTYFESKNAHLLGHCTKAMKHHEIRKNDVFVQENALTTEPNSFLSKNILQVMTAIQ